MLSGSQHAQLLHYHDGLWPLVHSRVFLHFPEYTFDPLGTFTCISMGLENPSTNFWLRGYLLANKFWKMPHYQFFHRLNISVSDVIRQRSLLFAALTSLTEYALYGVGRVRFRAKFMESKRSNWT
jgi:hypothetical protein